jgi:hypothetical protein
MKTSELTGAALDWAVAKCDGRDIEFDDPHDPWLTRDGIADQPLHSYTPSTDWAQGGPILGREGIEVRKGNPLYFPKGNEKGDYYEDLWVARKTQEHLPPGMRGVYEKWGTTPLIAAMRCYVTSKLGDEVEIPEELK